MIYNTELQTNNTDLQNILNDVSTLPSKGNSKIQKWTFVLEDDTTVEKYVEIPKYYEIQYNLAAGFTSSNTITRIKSGDIYRTTLTAPEGIYQYRVSLGFEGSNGWFDLPHGILVKNESVYELVIDPDNVGPEESETFDGVEFGELVTIIIYAQLK